MKIFPILAVFLTPAAFSAPSYNTNGELEANIRNEVRSQFSEFRPSPLVHCYKYMNGSRCRMALKVSAKCEINGKSRMMPYKAVITVNRRSYSLNRTSMDNCKNRDKLLQPFLQGIPYQRTVTVAQEDLTTGEAKFFADAD